MNNIITDQEVAQTIADLNARDTAFFSACLAGLVLQWQSGSALAPTTATMRSLMRNALGSTLSFKETMHYFFRSES